MALLTDPLAICPVAVINGTDWHGPGRKGWNELLRRPRRDFCAIVINTLHNGFQVKTAQICSPSGRSFRPVGYLVQGIGKNSCRR